MLPLMLPFVRGVDLCQSELSLTRHICIASSRRLELNGYTSDVRFRSIASMAVLYGMLDHKSMDALLVANKQIN